MVARPIDEGSVWQQLRNERLSVLRPHRCRLLLWPAWRRGAFGTRKRGPRVVLARRDAHRHHEVVLLCTVHGREPWYVRRARGVLRGTPRAALRAPALVGVE